MFTQWSRFREGSGTREEAYVLGPTLPHMTPMASRKRYLRRRSALGQLNTILLVARPLLRRRLKLQVRGFWECWWIVGKLRTEARWPWLARWQNPDSLNLPGLKYQTELLLADYLYLLCRLGPCGCSFSSF